MRKRFSLANDARLGWHVDMPTYRLIAGSFLPVVPKVIEADGILAGNASAILQTHMPTAIVELPDDTPLDLLGNVDAAALRKLYRGHPRFGMDTWSPPAEHPL